MGRPIKKVYFGTLNAGGVGGESISTTITMSDQGTGYSAGTAAVTFSAPEIGGGITATGTINIGNVVVGNIASVTVTNVGSGYLSAPSVIFTGANTSPAVGSASLTSSTTNTIACSAWVLGDSTYRVGDIVKQTGARSFRVTTSGGTSKCKLVTTANPAAAGEMTITATFAGSETFRVAKITDRVVYSTDGRRWLWTVGTASNVGDVITVSIGN